MKGQLADYIEDNNLMFKYQYGFRKYHFTDYVTIEGVAHDLLKNYLENLKQFVQLNDHRAL